LTKVALLIFLNNRGEVAAPCKWFFIEGEAALSEGCSVAVVCSYPKQNACSICYGGRGVAQIVPSCGYWGGVYPDTPEVVDRGRAGRGLSRGIARARRGEGG